MNSHPVHKENLRLVTKRESINLLRKIGRKDKFLISEEDFNLVTKDKVQKALFLKCQGVFERLIKPVVISSAMESESISPGSGDLSLIFTLSMLGNFISRDDEINDF